MGRAQGIGASLVKITVHFWGAWPAQNSCTDFAFQGVIAMINFA